MPPWKYFSVVLMLFLLATTGLWAQSASDLSLVKGHSVTETRFDEARPAYAFAGRSAIGKYNPVSAVFGGLLYGYQRYFSPQLSADCAYHTSCSRFSVEAIQRYGLFKGVALTADRLTRCSQLSVQDVHPDAHHPESHKVEESLDSFKQAGQ